MRCPLPNPQLFRIRGSILTDKFKYLTILDNCLLNQVIEWLKSRDVHLPKIPSNSKSTIF